MKSPLRFLAISAISLVIATGADAAKIVPSKKYITRTVTSGNFNAVRTNSSLDIIYTVGPKKIEIYAPDNLMPYIKVSISGKEIRVNYSENMTINGSHKSVVRISAPSVSRFTTGSAGDIKIQSPLNLPNEEVSFHVLSAGDIDAKSISAKSFKMIINSAGDIDTGNIRANDVSLITNSAGDIETGVVTALNTATIVTNSAGDIEMPEVVGGKNVSIASNSAGDIKIREVSAPSASFIASSAGDIKVSNVKVNTVTSSARSAGDITLSGICKQANLTARSTGDINAAGLKSNVVYATVSSVSDIHCWPLEELQATRSGRGEIRYKGKPTRISISSSKNSGVRPL